MCSELGLSVYVCTLSAHCYSIINILPYIIDLKAIDSKSQFL